MTTLHAFTRFVRGSLRIVLRGNALYGAWIAALFIMIGVGLYSYVVQLRDGLVTTSMRDQVSWAYYIGNFTFLVGVADAAVLLIIPAYVYRWRPIKEIVVLGVLLAIAAIVMCALFVLVDVGRPERLWHLIPGFGVLNLPNSLLAWDVIAVNGYLLLNLTIATYFLFTLYRGKEPSERFFRPLIVLSVPAGIAVHLVTAFLYSGVPARPFWNSAILAPRFLASAFSSGPAVLLIVLQLLRKFTRFEIRDEAIWKIGELMAYAMGVNLLLFGAEAFVDFYSGTEHSIHMEYMFAGIEGHTAIVPYMWMSLAASLAAFVLLLVPATRKNPVTLTIGCLLTYFGVYVEKGMGLVIPGFTPGTLGEIYEYVPSTLEVLVSMGVFSLGFLLFTLMVKVAMPILLGEFRGTAAEATE